MQFSDCVEQYLASRAICPQYAQSLRFRAQRFARWCKDASCGCLTEDNLNRFLQQLGRAPSTVKGYRGDLLVLWRWCSDLGHATWPHTRRVLRPNVPRIVPDCWTTEEVRELLRMAATLRGRHRDGVRRRDYWVATIRVGYESGLRRADCWRVRLASVRRDGLICSVNHKTGVRVTHRLSQDTLHALEAIGTPFPLAWCYDQRHFCRYFQSQIVAKSDVRPGTFRWLRRASGSYVEALSPGAGARHLGHTSSATFRTYYDSQLVADAASVVMPPTL